MPQEIAATLSRITLLFSMLRAFIQPMQSASATHAPVIEAVRVPPSACSTSQFTVIWRSPERLEVERRAQRAADQALDFDGAAILLAGGRLAAIPGAVIDQTPLAP